MDTNVVLIGLLAVSVLTQLTTQAIKILMDKTATNYAANIIAAVVAVVMSVAMAAGYAVFEGVPIDARYIITGIALAYLSFLSATVGYDKVMQALKQIKLL